MAGIDKESRTINKPVLMYGIIISIMYIVYLYIIEKTSIYRYVIYLILLILNLIIDRINSKQKNKNNYTYSLLMIILIMAIFTGEYITINTTIATLLTISIYLILQKLINKKREEQYNKKIKIGLILSIFNITYFIIVLTLLKLI